MRNVLLFLVFVSATAMDEGGRPSGLPQWNGDPVVFRTYFQALLAFLATKLGAAYCDGIANVNPDNWWSKTSELYATLNAGRKREFDAASRLINMEPSSQRTLSSHRV